MPVARYQFFATTSGPAVSVGAPLAGSCVFTYQAGTTTPQNTYTDSTGGTANSNPVLLDSANCATGKQQWSVDTVSQAKKINGLIANPLSGQTGSGDYSLSIGGSLLPARIGTQIDYACNTGEFGTGDLGQRINNADSDLGSNSGYILVDKSCGTTIGTTPSISSGHILQFIDSSSYTLNACFKMASNTAIIAPRSATFTLGNNANCDMVSNSTANARQRITSLSRSSNTVAATTATAHGYATGNQVFIWNATPTLSSGSTSFPNAVTDTGVLSWVNGIRVTGNTSFTYSQNGVNDSITGNAAVALVNTAQSNISVIGGTWDGNGDQQTTDVAIIYLENVANPLLRDLTIKAIKGTYSNYAGTAGVLTGVIQCVACSSGLFDNLSVANGWDIGLSLALSSRSVVRNGHYFANAGSGIDDSSGWKDKFDSIDCHSNSGGCLSLNSPYSEITGGNFDAEMGNSSGSGIVLGHEGFPCNGCRATGFSASRNAVAGVSIQGSATTDFSVTSFDVEGNDSTHANNGGGIVCASSSSRGTIGPGVIKANSYGLRLNGCPDTTIIGLLSSRNYRSGARLENGSNGASVIGGAYWDNGIGGLAQQQDGIGVDSVTTHTYICARAFDDGPGTQKNGVTLAVEPNTLCPMDLSGNSIASYVGANASSATLAMNGIIKDLVGLSGSGLETLGTIRKNDAHNSGLTIQSGSDATALFGDLGSGSAAQKLSLGVYNGSSLTRILELNSSGISQFNGNPTVLGGIASEIYSAASSSTNLNISPTIMATSPASTTRYRLSFYIDQTNVGIGCSGTTTVTLNVIYTDPNSSGTNTLPVGTYNVATNGNGVVGNVIGQTIVTVVSKASTNVQYSTTNFTAGAGCSIPPSYQVYPTMEVF